MKYFASSLIEWSFAIITELFLFPLSLIIRPLAYFKQYNKRSGSLSCRPILLVHGYLHNSTAWIYIKQKLASEGLGPIYTVNLSHPFDSIVTHAKRLEAVRQKIARETKRKDLVLVGHSMGGLVSSLYATKIAPPDTITDVITIGSPLKGTYIASIALGENGKEMRYNSSFAQKLQETILSHPTIRFYHIGTTTDQLIVPCSSAWLDQKKDRNLKTGGLGHLGLLVSSRVVEQLKQWLSPNCRAFSDN